MAGVADNLQKGINSRVITIERVLSAWIMGNLTERPRESAAD